MVNLSGTGDLSLEDTVNLRGTLKMSAGNLDTKDNLVLVSDARGTANIGKVEVGASISGMVGYQRYWSRTRGGYYYIGVPVKGQILSDWEDDFTILGTPSNPANWQNTAKFDEGTYSWTGLTNDNEPISPGEGVDTYMFNANFSDGFIRNTNLGAPVIGSGDDGIMTTGEKFAFTTLQYTAWSKWRVEFAGQSVSVDN